MEQEVIECQDCGKTLKVLTPQEAQQVARNPYNFVIYCRECTKERSELHL